MYNLLIKKFGDIQGKKRRHSRATASIFDAEDR